MHGAPLYIAETSPSQIRGTLISLKEVMIVLGILVIFCRIPAQHFIVFVSYIAVSVESESQKWLLCSLVTLLGALRLMQLEGGVTCMGLVLLLQS